MKVHWKIGGDNHYFYPSAVMCGQFSSFLSAVYCLYAEDGDYHTNCRNRSYVHKEHPFAVSTTVHWDEEGQWDEIKFTRTCDSSKAVSAAAFDRIDISINYAEGKYAYTVDGRDLCYAIAKGCTEALKKYGFRGYFVFSGSQHFPGDSFDLNQLLFLKAYALGVMDARSLRRLWYDPTGWNPNADASSFEKEIELLLFDM